MNKCPYLIIDEHNYFPVNTCKCKWNYCNYPGDYKFCDVYKRHSRAVSRLVSAIKKGQEENGTTNSGTNESISEQTMEKGLE